MTICTPRSWKGKKEEALGGQNIHQQPDPQQDPLRDPCQSEVWGL